MNNDPKDKKILYFYAVRTSFVAKDIEMLSHRYAMIEYRTDLRKTWLYPYVFIKQAVFLLRNIRTAKAVLCFFAGYHSLLPAVFGRLFRRPVIIFMGGADAYRFPAFNYGHFNKYLIGRFTCLSARLADLLVPVDDCLMYSKSDYYNEADAIQGIGHFCKNLHTPHQTVRLEYDPGFFVCNSAKKRNSFMTAAFGIEGASFIRKGIDLVIEVARLLPDCEFTILGCQPEAIKVPVPGNVRIVPPVTYAELPAIYAAHRFYLQLSIAEGFPSAVCESMLCECVPIGSRVAAIPFIIGDAGFILEKRDVNLLKSLIENIISRDDLPEIGKKARQRIIENFYPGTRSKVLFDIIEKMAHD
jgi:glycosyltransferase involved in cell wall biosynthesis